MASKYLYLERFIQIYSKRNLKLLCQSYRCFSNQDHKTNECSKQNPNPTSVKDEHSMKWMNIKSGILGPDDERLPLPGDIGASNQIDNLSQNEIFLNNFKQSAQLFTKTIDSFLTTQERNFENIRKTKIVYDEIGRNLRPKSINENQEHVLECKVQQCPALLKKDFQLLFPNVDMNKNEVKVLTLCQKTENDMSSWSSEVENERQELTEYFIECATRMCDRLRSHGFWADFIDPSSGRPFSGVFTNSTFFETDSRYRLLGFTIDDLGCCKVISHRQWGTNIFVGALCTTAPIDEIEEVLSPLKISIAN